jgi:hypothetical protein
MASTYVNDLRLNEMATGDGSGTWGTTTNTNLELIAEAFSYGTEVITTNADTHTTTIADGATDPGRSLYLKYTGTLDSACTITIGPNTVSKVWIVSRMHFRWLAKYYSFSRLRCKHHHSCWRYQSCLFRRSRSRSSVF